MGKAEGVIEDYLVQQVKAHGGESWKLGGNGILGLPDRVNPMPGGFTLWVEVKAPGKKADPIQQHYLDVLHNMTHIACVVSTKEEVDNLLTFYTILRDGL
jgi:hypothetical protein